MQIYEITNGRRMQEVFAPGGVLPQAGLFLGGVGKHLAKAMIPAGGNTDAAPAPALLQDKQAVQPLLLRHLLWLH